VEYGGELFRPAVHPETGDTVFIDGVLLPLPKLNTVTAFDTIQPCNISPIGDVRLASEFIVMPEKLPNIDKSADVNLMCEAALIPIIAVIVGLYFINTYGRWVEFGKKFRQIVVS
jgi:hypothetical protein